MAPVHTGILAKSEQDARILTYKYPDPKFTRGFREFYPDSEPEMRVLLWDHFPSAGAVRVCFYTDERSGLREVYRSWDPQRLPFPNFLSRKVSLGRMIDLVILLVIS